MTNYKGTDYFTFDELYQIELQAYKQHLLANNFIGDIDKVKMPKYRASKAIREKGYISHRITIDGQRKWFFYQEKKQ